MAGGDHGLYTRRCQVEDRWLSFRGRIEIFISILPEDLKVFRYTHEEKLTLPKFGIALKSLSAYELVLLLVSSSPWTRPRQIEELSRSQMMPR